MRLRKTLGVASIALLLALAGCNAAVIPGPPDHANDNANPKGPDKAMFPDTISGDDISKHIETLEENSQWQLTQALTLNSNESDRTISSETTYKINLDTETYYKNTSAGVSTSEKVTVENVTYQRLVSGDRVEYRSSENTDVAPVNVTTAYGTQPLLTSEEVTYEKVNVTTLDGEKVGVYEITKEDVTADMLGMSDEAFNNLQSYRVTVYVTTDEYIKQTETHYERLTDNRGLITYELVQEFTNLGDVNAEPAWLDDAKNQTS